MPVNELSPAALAVWEAFNQEPPTMFVDYGECLAAALRAAADQLLPVCSTQTDSGMQRMAIRNDLLVIAEELEAQ